MAVGWPGAPFCLTYDNSYTLTELETNSTGAPDIAKFRAKGLCCSSWGGYSSRHLAEKQKGRL